MKVWVLVILHSYMIPEHFYTISNAFMQFTYTLIWSWILLYNPKINKNFILVIRFFKHLFSVKKGITGMKFLIYVIVHTLIRSWTLLYNSELSYTILNTFLNILNALKRSQAKKP